MTDSSRGRLAEHIDTIEKSYEFFLAYAAQGLRGGEGSKISDQLLEALDNTIEALAELSSLVEKVATGREVSASEELQAFREVVEEDAVKAGAAVKLVRAQETVSSQLIDNLNASVHLRALLTDLFLLDEVLKLNAPRSKEEEAKVG